MSLSAKSDTVTRCGHNAGGRVVRAWIGALLSVVVALGLMSTTVSAALTHATVESTIPIGAECTVPHEVEVDETAELIYAVCGGFNNPSLPIIKRFHFDGSPAPFGFSAPYISGNAIIGNPNSTANRWSGLGSGVGATHQMPLAVDNTSARNGFLYVSGGCPAVCGSNFGNEEKVEIFARSGEWQNELPSETRPGGGGRAADISIGSDGSIYVVRDGGGIRKYSPASFTEVRRLMSGTVEELVAVDSTGSVWSGYHPGPNGFEPDFLTKWEPDQFGTDLQHPNPAFEGMPLATPSPFVSPTNALEIPNPQAIDVDLVSDDLYVNTTTKITPYSSGSAEEFTHQNGPAVGVGVLTDSQDVDVLEDGRVVATNIGSGEAKVVVFGPGDIVPNIRTPAPQIDDIGHTTATLRAHIERAGGGPITECQLEYGTTTAYSGGIVPCSPDPAASPPGSNFTNATEDVSAAPAGLTTGTTYHYRFKAGNEKGSNLGGDRTVTPVFVIKLRTEAATGINTHEATLHGSFDPDGISETKYYFEYGIDTNYGEKTPEVEVASTPGKYDAEATLSALPMGRTIHYRLVARNPNGVTRGEDRTFRVAAPPEISGLRATNVAAESATLNARIDPGGYDTTYRFEYGTTSGYGSSAPVPDGDIGSVSSPVAISHDLEGLTPGFTYHYRLRAENQWGTSVSEDTTFDFAPPSCPNEHARQQTNASYLPDCRAYELVSPRSAGSVIFFPSEELVKLNLDPTLQQWPVNRGLATGPSRFAYSGGLGSITDVDAPNSLLDIYTATRTNSGWMTRISGFRGSEASFAAEKQCSDSLDLCIDHNVGDPFYGLPGETVPYLFDADGNRLGQLPTNVKVVPGGTTFVGDQRPSYDFSHFVFSSNTAVFAPDGLSSPPGSAYDNAIGEHAVTLISHEPGGGPISAPGTAFIKFPGISTDGSHVLMQVTGIGGPAHLYMRVNDSITYDVSDGAGVTFVGMTRDGSRVFFVASQQLTADDVDNSADLYMWQESGDSLTRISTGNSQDNIDSCAATWTTGCGVKQLLTEAGNPFGRVSVPGLDDLIARESGDVYFYSPSSLDPARPGVANQRNLYVYRNGSVHLVATFDPGTQVNRMQISPDGHHAAMVTASRLTGYDNKGFKEMYTYDAESGAVRCVSCRPDGLPPTAHVAASQGGPFMADDGRPFFATKDSLVARDTNGLIDVYEFVGGRPQLITSGTGTRDSIPGALSLFKAVNIGLEAVSSNGVDVYFSTYETLVPEDENGSFVKMYDARTGGGFDFQYKLAPCEAADECHGDTSLPSAPLGIATNARLGSVGNAAGEGRAKRKRKHGKRRKKRAHRRNGSKRRAGRQRNG